MTLILYQQVSIFLENCEGGTLAYAGPCYVEPAMGSRPYIGFVNYCPGVSYNLA